MDTKREPGYVYFVDPKTRNQIFNAPVSNADICKLSGRSMFVRIRSHKNEPIASAIKNFHQIYDILSGMQEIGFEYIDKNSGELKRYNSKEASVTLRSSIRNTAIIAITLSTVKKYAEEKPSSIFEGYDEQELYYITTSPKDALRTGGLYSFRENGDTVTHFFNRGNGITSGDMSRNWVSVTTNRTNIYGEPFMVNDKLILVQHHHPDKSVSRRDENTWCFAEVKILKKTIEHLDYEEKNKIVLEITNPSYRWVKFDDLETPDQSQTALSYKYNGYPESIVNIEYDLRAQVRNDVVERYGVYYTAKESFIKGVSPNTEKVALITCGELDKVRIHILTGCHKGETYAVCSDSIKGGVLSPNWREYVLKELIVWLGQTRCGKGNFTYKITVPFPAHKQVGEFSYSISYDSKLNANRRYLIKRGLCSEFTQIYIDKKLIAEMHIDNTGNIGKLYLVDAESGRLYKDSWGIFQDFKGVYKSNLDRKKWIDIAAKHIAKTIYGTSEGINIL